MENFLQVDPRITLGSVYLFSFTRTHQRDQTVRIWDPLTGESKMELRGHEHDVEVVIFAPIAAYAAIRELAGIPVRFCKIRFTILLRLALQHGDHTKRHGLYVASGARDKTIKIWDTHSGRLLRNLVSSAPVSCQ